MILLFFVFFIVKILLFFEIEFVLVQVFTCTDTLRRQLPIDVSMCVCCSIQSKNPTKNKSNFKGKYIIKLGNLVINPAFLLCVHLFD